jgi:hypothetical protein
MQVLQIFYFSLRKIHYICPIIYSIVGIINIRSRCYKLHHLQKVLCLRLNFKNESFELLQPLRGIAPVLIKSNATCQNKYILKVFVMNKNELSALDYVNRVRAMAPEPVGVTVLLLAVKVRGETDVNEVDSCDELIVTYAYV